MSRRKGRSKAGAPRPERDAGGCYDRGEFDEGFVASPLVRLVVTGSGERFVVLREEDYLALLALKDYRDVDGPTRLALEAILDAKLKPRANPPPRGDIDDDLPF